MSDSGPADGARYWAFISYSHKDAAFGRRLHRRLENYALPRRLVGRETRQGAVPRKLAPIFRDREELPAANDLSAEVRAALAASRSLIVVCSPGAAASPWVGREIEAFRELHPGRPVLAAIRQGEPADCFPGALHRLGPDGTVLEPLAADFRKGQDGEQLGVLKLVAGIVGVGLDELVQRDALRRTQRVTAVTAGALAAMIAMGVLTVFALSAQREAERQRGEAEGLVEYMLTDLRDRLKGVGRLDVMGAVNARAMDYYAKQDLSALPPESLERRARILHAMGEDDETRADHQKALNKFREARRTTLALLDREPDNPERIFDHAQSEYYFGLVYYEQDRNAPAMAAFREYKRLSDRAAVLAPQNPKYLREAGYADGNLCSMAQRPPAAPSTAIELCRTALAKMERAAKYLGPESGITDDIVNRHAWLADSYVLAGDLGRARAERTEEGRMLDKQMADDPRNMSHKSDWVALQVALSRMDEKTSRPELALTRLTRALDMLDSMIRYEPAHADWRARRNWIREEIKKLKAGLPTEGNSK